MIVLPVASRLLATKCTRCMYGSARTSEVSNVVTAALISGLAACTMPCTAASAFVYDACSVAIGMVAAFTNAVSNEACSRASSVQNVALSTPVNVGIVVAGGGVVELAVAEAGALVVDADFALPLLPHPASTTTESTSGAAPQRRARPVADVRFSRPLTPQVSAAAGPT